MPNYFTLQDNSSSPEGDGERSYQYQLRVVLTFAPCVIFLYINGVMLYTLRSMPVLRETSRYLLLYSLLLAETFQMALAQLMCLLSILEVYMTRLACVLLLTPTIICTVISPFNLAVMSLERYVAVCFPLRYASIANADSTHGAIAVVWSISLANMLIRVLMLVGLNPRPFGQSMGVSCSKNALFQSHKIFTEFESGFVCVEFILVGLIVICSYVGVIMAAKAASTQKQSAVKASKTILLHMIQLCLSLSSTMVNTILTALYGKIDRHTFRWVWLALFVGLINLPRCLSCLIYGLRDQTIRPLLKKHLRLGIKWRRKQDSDLHFLCQFQYQE